jgi:hypothetical protein
MRCPISFIPLAELEHPVVFRYQKALTVYDAEHLITWLQTSRRNPVTNVGLNPLVPLKDFLLPYRLPHTTEAQLAQTQRMLEERVSRAKVVEGCASALWAWMLRWVYPVFDVAMTPLVMSVSLLLTVALIVLSSEFLMCVLEWNRIPRADMLPPYIVLEEFVRAHNQVVVYMGLVYVRCMHPPVATVLRVYLGSDFAVRWWCEGLASVKELPWVQTAGVRLVGVDALLLVCKG